MTPGAAPSPWDRRIDRSAWLAAAGVGAIEAFAERHSVTTGDAVAYLDIADAYRRGDWGSAINGFWSPLYSWVLAGALALAHPSPYREAAVVHVANWLVSLAALAAFVLLLREMQPSSGSGPASITAERVPVFPVVWRLFAYALFLWSSLNLISVGSHTPDMCVAVFVYLAAALLLRIHRGGGSPRVFVLLGVVLGFGYLAKGTMFPLAFVFIGTALMSVGLTRRGLLLALTAVLAFAVVSGPFVVALSLQKGRPTFSDSGKLHYAWIVNGVPQYHWQGGDGADGVPLHPTRRIVDSPATFEFGHPVGGSYPIWYDPSYWYEGIRPRYSELRRPLALLAWVKEAYCCDWRDGLRVSLLVVVALAGLLVLARSRGQSLVSGGVRYWPLWPPVLVSLAIYAMLGVQVRRLAPFVAVGVLTLVSSLRWPPSAFRRWVASAMVLALALLLFMSVVRVAAPALPALAGGVDHPHWRIAQALAAAGVKPGDRIASIGADDGYWTRLAGVKMVAEVPDVSAFSSASEAAQRRVLDALAGAGVRAVVSRTPVRVGSAAHQWQAVADTGYMVLKLVD
jgi:hypothetical protein